MIQPLNYTPKAIIDLDRLAGTMPALDRAGIAYLVAKLRAAQVFVLPDYGQLIDRAKPRPELPEILFRPPFPVVALEYQAPAETGYGDPIYGSVPSSRRIALAWTWDNDLPPSLRGWVPESLEAGVVVASISYLDHNRAWQPMAVAMHIPFDGAYANVGTTVRTPFERAAVESGRISAKVLAGPRLRLSPVCLLPSPVIAGTASFGQEAMMGAVQADMMDEVNAYIDLCSALACRNVSVEQRPASKALNHHRRRSGKPLLKDMHVLKLGGAEMEGAPSGGGDRAGPRSHLRRGHIRRLGSDRITWVNQTMVSGRTPGFVDKVYAL